MSILTSPTTCRYFDIDETGRILTNFFWNAWDDPADQNGDGQEEFDSFLEATRENGFTVTELTGEISIGPGIPDDVHNIRVFRADDGDTVKVFGLAVVHTNGYWDRESRDWIVVGA